MSNPNNIEDKPMTYKIFGYYTRKQIAVCANYSEAIKWLEDHFKVIDRKRTFKHTEHWYVLAPY